MGHRRLFTVGEIAARVGLSRQTLHVWIRAGLLVPAEVTPGGHRRFSGKVVRRIDAIRALAARMPLAEVGAALRSGARDDDG